MNMLLYWFRQYEKAYTGDSNDWLELRDEFFDFILWMAVEAIEKPQVDWAGIDPVKWGMLDGAD